MSEHLDYLILRTLSYSDIFSFPLTKKEVCVRLGKDLEGKSSYTQQEVEDGLLRLLSSKKIEKQGIFYCLVGRTKTVTARYKKMCWSLLRWQEVNTLKVVFQRIPWISAVYITGSLSMDNLHSRGDDIDVLIVTRAGRLWLTRAIVILLFSLLGKYRLHDQEGRYQWCFNLWLDEDHVQLSDSYHNIYTAYEILQAKQVVGSENILRASNQWLKHFLSTSLKFTAEKKSTKKSRKDPFRLFEHLAYTLQSQYMKKRMTIERVAAGYAFFHPRPTDQLVLRQYYSNTQS